MEVPVPSLENLKAGWSWTVEKLQLWFEVLKDPAGVLKKIDLNSTTSAIDAIQFAIFPILLACVITLPIYLMTKDTTLGFLGYFIVALITAAGSTLVYSIAQRISAIFLRGKGTFNACAIATLYAAAFRPLVDLTNYFQVNHRELIRKVSDGNTRNALPPDELITLTGDFLITLVLAAYLTVKFVPVTCYVHGVGRLRAVMIIWLTMIIGFITVGLLLNSLLRVMFFGL